MKNKITDLNNYLFAQLERLEDEELTAEGLDKEISRAKAICDVSGQIIQTGRLAVEAAKIQSEYISAKITKLPTYLEVTIDE